MPRPLLLLSCCLTLGTLSLVGGACTHTSSSEVRSTAALERPAVSLSGKTMGVDWHVTLAVVVATDGSDVATALAAIQAALDRVDGRMSTYQPDSEISRFKNAPAATDFVVSAETATVVQEALRISALSEGAFDATVMPLVDLWGFGPAAVQAAAPSPAEIQAALAICGWQKLHAGPTVLRKDVAGLSIDLSAIAKGYGVDAVCAALLENGYADFMVEVGGELRTSGKSRRVRLGGLVSMRRAISPTWGKSCRLCWNWGVLPWPRVVTTATFAFWTASAFRTPSTPVLVHRWRMTWRRSLYSRQTVCWQMPSPPRVWCSAQQMAWN